MATTNVQYRYRFNDIYLIHGREVVQLSWTNVASFYILKDYDNNIRPAYEISLQVDAKTRIWLSNHQNDFQVYLDIQKIIMDTDGNQISPSSQVIRGTFIAFNNTATSLSTERIREGSNLDTSDTNDLTEMVPDDVVKIGLIQQEMYNRSMSSANTIVVRDNMQNIVASMLTRAGFKKVLMCPFQNYNMYEDIIIPPLPLYRAIQYLDFKYSFYKAGSIVFYDYDTVYIIDTSMKHLVYPRNGNPYATLNIFDATEEVVSGHVGNSKDRRELNASNIATTIVFGEDLTTSKSESVTVVDVDSGSRGTINYDPTNLNPLSSTKVVYGKEGSAEFVKQRQLENKVRISVGGYHYDIDSFAPNIVTSIYHSIPSTQSRIAGKYRISSVVSVLTNNGGNFVSNTGIDYCYCGS